MNFLAAHRARRSGRTFTVLRVRKPLNWKDVQLVAKSLFPMMVSHRTAHPTILLLHGECAPEQMPSAVGILDGYDLQVVVGLDDPALPFKPGLVS